MVAREGVPTVRTRVRRPAGTLTAVSALHDLDPAATFRDRIEVMNAGRVAAAGSPAEVITQELVAVVYRVGAVVSPDGPEGRPSVRFCTGRP